MKCPVIIILLLVLITSVSLYAALPQFYVTGQLGRFEANAGSIEDAGYYSHPNEAGQSSIKSGTKSFYDWSVGAEFNRWFSLEAGFVHFNSFSSPWMTPLPPGVETVVAVPDNQLTYRLQAYRLTPSVRLPLTSSFGLRFLGGISHSDGRVVTGQMIQGLPPRYTEIKSASYTNDSYHLGVGIDCTLSRSAAIAARFVWYDFGKIPGQPSAFSPHPSGGRISVASYSLGFSWRF